MTDATTASLGLSFTAGLASFLSPCVLPLVPSYLTFVTGMTLDEMTGVGALAARRRAMLHAGLFVAGFALVFVALGATATAFGVLLARSLVLIQRIGGVVIVLFGVYLLGLIKLPSLMRERRVTLADRPSGLAGSVVVGIAFGAGWTPCVGPVLASILLYAGTTGSMLRGASLLATYALGLGIPFLVAAYAFEWFVTSRRTIARWVRPIERLTGALLVLVGLMLASGRFSALSGFLAGFGQLIPVGG